MEKVTSFKTGPGEMDSIDAETLLMKLAVAETIAKLLSNYADILAANDVQVPDHITLVDDWAVSAMFQNLAEVSHALKCGCFGHEAAHLH